LDSVARILEVVAGVLLLGALGEFVFERTGIPDVIWLVCAGVLAGPVFEIVSPSLLEPAVPLFGALALIIILSGGAYRLRLEDMAAAGPRALLLGAAGFVFSVASVCLWLWLVTAMGFVRPAPFLAWLIAGAIVGGTSSLIIMPTTGAGKVDPRTARLLEVESASTDGLSIVMTMVLIDVLVTGGTSLARPFVALGRELGVGVGVGVLAVLALIPVIPALRASSHAYTAFLCVMLVVYGVTSQFNGNGAMAVLTAALLLGNASAIVPRLIPGAQPLAFVADERTHVIQGQMSFLIKSFFFVLIGLMFPTSPRLILLGALPVLFLLAARIPAVWLATVGLGLSRKQFLMLTVAVPRGLASGVLSAIPVSHDIAGPDFPRAIFSLIVTSILVFCLGAAVVGRMREEQGTGMGGGA
jgi:cell volume regulation protein A